MNLILSRYRKMIPDYLEDSLSDRDRLAFERAMASSQTLKAAVEEQKKLLERLDLVTHAGTDHLSEHFSARVMAAVGQETQPSSKHGQLKHTGLIAAVAVAAVLAFGIWQIYPLLITGTDGQASFGASDTSARVADSNATPENASQTEDVLQVDDSGSWVMAQDLYKNMEAMDQTLEESFQNTLDLVCLQDGPILDEIQDEALQIHRAWQLSDPPKLVILAAFDEKQADRILSEIKIAFSTCENPVRIEIIKGDRLVETMTQIDQDLASLANPEDSPEATWILILIGA